MASDTDGLYFVDKDGNRIYPSGRAVGNLDTGGEPYKLVNPKDGTVYDLSKLGGSSYGDEDAQDAVGTILGPRFLYDDTNNAINLDDEAVQDLVGAMAASGLAYDDANNSLEMDAAASGQVTLSSGKAVVDTAISATDATFQLALGIDDPNADCKVTGRLFWDDSAGTYKVEIVEDGTSVGNPTVNYDIIRVR